VAAAAAVVGDVAAAAGDVAGDVEELLGLRSAAERSSAGSRDCTPSPLEPPALPALALAAAPDSTPGTLDRASMGGRASTGPSRSRLRACILAWSSVEWRVSRQLLRMDAAELREVAEVCGLLSVRVGMFQLERSEE